MIAHLLTFARLVFAAAFAGAVAWFARVGLDAAGVAILLVLAGLEELTDALDGPVARRYGTPGVVGGVLDPLADSLARLAMYFAMALAGWVTIAAPLAMAGRDIVAAYMRVFQALAGGRTSARLSGKLKAIVQGGGVFVIVALAYSGRTSATPIFGSIGSLRLVAASVIIAVTLWSMIDYIIAAWPAIGKSRDSHHFFPKDRDEW